MLGLTGGIGFEILNKVVKQSLVFEHKFEGGKGKAIMGDEISSQRTQQVCRP